MPDVVQVKFLVQVFAGLLIPRSSCRRNEAAFGGAAVVKSGCAVCQTDIVFSFRDGFAAERSLVPSAAATASFVSIQMLDQPPRGFLAA